MKAGIGKESSDDFFGFTLLEIVMTLVLIGILSSIAVPKYMDLSAEAERRAAAAPVTEGQIRINGLFASRLFGGAPCEDARLESMNLSKTADASAEGGCRYGAFILKAEDVSEEGGTASVSAEAVGSGRALGTVGTLRFPVCPAPVETELPGSSAGGGSGGTHPGGGSGSPGEGPDSGSGGDAPGSGSAAGEEGRPEAGGGTGNGGSAGNGGGGGSSAEDRPMENGRESLQNLAKHASTWEDILAYAKQHYGWLSSGTGASLIRYHDQMYVFINRQYVHGTESKDIHQAAQANHYLFEPSPARTVPGLFSRTTTAGPRRSAEDR